MEPKHGLSLDSPLLTDIHLYGELVAGLRDDRDLKRRLADGSLVRVRRGAYVAGSDWAALDRVGRHAVVARAVSRQAKTEVVLSHTSALALWSSSTWGFGLDEVHVTRPDGRSGRNAVSVHQHKGHLTEDEVVTIHDVQVTGPTRTGLDVTMLGASEAALCAVNDLLHRGLTTPQLLEERYTRSEAAHPTGMRHWPHSLSTEHVLRLADGRLESVAESRAWHLMWSARVPMPVPQVVVKDERGFVIKRVDFAWPHLGVFLEVNGKSKLLQHLREGESPADAVMRERRLIEQVSLVTGWRAIQWDWSDLERPASTGRRLQAVLRPPAVSA